VRRREGQRGQATVEFALLLPVLVMGLLAILQVALVVRDHIAVAHAAREAARAASVDPDPSAALRAAHSVLARAHVDVSTRPRVGEQITVVVTYRSHTDVPLVGALFPDPTLRSKVVMRVEK